MRLATFNVHMWLDAHMKRNPSRVAAALLALDADIIALNEAIHPDPYNDKDDTALAFMAEQQDMDHVPQHSSTNCLDVLAKALDAEYVFGRAWTPSAGNALLVRRRVGTIVASGNTLLRLTGVEDRSATWADIALHPPHDDGCHGARNNAKKDTKGSKRAAPKRVVRAVATHLCQLQEPHRMAQLRDLFGWLEETDVEGSKPVALMGDFNALTLADYPAAKLDHIAAQRARNGWEDPVEEVMSFARDGGWTDAWRHVHPASGEYPDATCWIGTRIDYIMLNRAWVAAMPPVACTIHANEDCSDHKPVTADLASAATAPQNE